MLAARRMMLAQADPRLWSIGGQVSNSNYSYDINAAAWSVMAYANFPAPSQTHNFAIGAIDGKVYTAGGYSGAGVVQSACYVYDPGANTWTTKTAMPHGVLGSAYCVLSGRLWVIGGNTAPTNQTWVQAYDPASDTWDTSMAQLPLAWTGAVAGVIAGKIYVASGNTNASTFPGICYVYDPGANTWTTKATQGTATYASSGATVAGKLYVVGGQATSGRTAVVQTYDPSANTWGTVASIPLGASDQHAACEFGGRLYVTGGRTGSGTGTVQQHAYAFDPAAGTWATLADEPSGQNDHGLAATN